MVVGWWCGDHAWLGRYAARKTSRGSCRGRFIMTSSSEYRGILDGICESGPAAVPLSSQGPKKEPTTADTRTCVAGGGGSAPSVLLANEAASYLLLFFITSAGLGAYACAPHTQTDRQTDTKLPLTKICAKFTDSPSHSRVSACARSLSLPLALATLATQ